MSFNFFKDTSEFVSPSVVQGGGGHSNEISDVRSSVSSDIDFLIAVKNASEELKRTSYLRAVEKSLK